jgi:hypothetical protein
MHKLLLHFAKELLSWNVSNLFRHDAIPIRLFQRETVQIRTENSDAKVRWLYNNRRRDLPIRHLLWTATRAQSCQALLPHYIVWQLVRDNWPPGVSSCTTPRRAASRENLDGHHLHWSQRASFKGQKRAAHSISKLARPVIAAAGLSLHRTERSKERVPINQTGCAS